MDRRLLVAYKNMLEFILIEDGVIDVQHCATRIAENVLNAFFGKTAHDNLCAGNF